MSSSQCPYGQVFNNGACTNICDYGFFYYQTICIYGGCYAGYADNGFGGCIRSTVQATFSCSPGQFLLNGNCVTNCGVGYFPDSLSQNCIICSANCAACFSSAYCITCQTGFQITNGACTPVASCPSNQLQYENSCISSCPMGTYQIGNQCTRSCPANTYYNNQVCFMSCPSGIRTADACVPYCPIGTTNQNGVCT